MRIFHLADLPEIGVSHNPDIKKKIILGKGFVPHLMTFAQATFKPGQKVDTHVHETMTEVFYIQNGRAEFIVEGTSFEVTAGDTVVIEAGEKHSQNNPFSQAVTWLYFGIAVD